MVSITVSDLEPLTREEMNQMENIDMVEFWGDREKESIARGFLRREYFTHLLKLVFFKYKLFLIYELFKTCLQNKLDIIKIGSSNSQQVQRHKLND